MTAAAWYEAARPCVRWTALSVLALFLAQGLVGAGTVSSGFEAGMKSAHLAVATLTWVAVVYVAALQVPAWPARLRHADEGPDRIAGLEGATH